METPPDGPGTEPATVPVDDLLSQEPLREAVAADREEVRRLVDAGASSPEEIRALAERIREQREREVHVWSSEMKPALIKARKGRFDLRDLRRERLTDDTDDGAQRSFLIVVGIATLVVLVVLSASNASIMLLLVPVVLFLGYAWRLGSRPDDDDTVEEPPA